MSDVNVMVLSGRLTNDPEVRTFPDGGKLVKLRLATNEQYKGKEITTYTDVEVRGQPADFAERFFKTGSSVWVTGKKKTDTWVDKNTQDKRSKDVMVADKAEFYGGGKKKDGDEASPDSGKDMF